jgi:hypothetical protein
MIDCNSVLLILFVSFFLPVENRFALKQMLLTRHFPSPHTGGAGTIARDNYREALRLRRRIINSTSAAPAAIQMIA